MNPIEPSADMRQWAHMLREMFLALVAEGFTEQQALVMIGQTISGAFQAGNGDS